MYQLKRQTIVQAPLKQVWEFISRPENLNRITPTDLDFTIVSTVPEKMYNGLLIEYRVKVPYFGTQQWITEIKHIRPELSFVDEQRIGPYRFWYHYHELQQTGTGVKIVDEVSYHLPFGMIGRLMHALLIRKTLNRIFDYRGKRFLELFSAGSK